METQGTHRKEERKSPERKAVWTRRFDCDEVIVIEDDSKYLQEDRELVALLESNSNTLEELRRELQSFY